LHPTTWMTFNDVRRLYYFIHPSIFFPSRQTLFNHQSQVREYPGAVTAISGVLQPQTSLTIPCITISRTCYFPGISYMFLYRTYSFQRIIFLTNTLKWFSSYYLSNTSLKLLLPFTIIHDHYVFVKFE